MAPPSSRRWVFTLNFTDEVPNLVEKFSKASKYVGYSIWQHERVTHDHLQGYIQFSDNVRRKTVNNILGGHSFVEPASSTHEQCIKYCSKPESRIAGPWTYGIPVVERSNKRKLYEAYARSPERLMAEDPMKYRRVEVNIKNAVFMNTPLEGEFDKPWQISLNLLLEKPPDRRTVYWVYGPSGNDGKTHFALSLVKRSWYYTKGGKKDNVVYQYMSNIDRNVVMDIPRESKDYIQYDLLEMFKDRTLISNKYEPLTGFSHKPIHVVVMANFLPDYEKISRDRIYVLTC